MSTLKRAHMFCKVYYLSSVNIRVSSHTHILHFVYGSHFTILQKQTFGKKTNCDLTSAWYNVSHVAVGVKAGEEGYEPSLLISRTCGWGSDKKYFWSNFRTWFVFGTQMETKIRDFSVFPSFTRLRTQFYVVDVICAVFVQL